MRNSWGSDWGEGGYFWVSYYDESFARDHGLGGYGGATSYSVVEDTGNYSRAYQYDKLGVTDHWGFDSTRVWGANRFTAASTQTITAAGFYALSSPTRYEVWAGRTLRSLSRRASGTVRAAGLHHRAALQDVARCTRARGSWSPSSWSRRARRTPWPSSARRAAWMSGATAKAGPELPEPRRHAVDRRDLRAGREQCLHQGLRRVTASSAAPA